MRYTVVVAALLALAGCSKPDGKPGAAAAAFTLDGPAGPVEVLNGGPAVKTPVEVRWKTGTPEELSLAATVEPRDQGVSVTMEPVVLPGEGKAQAVVRASETARAGDYKVTVTGKTDRAGTATIEITVKVPPID
jgi:hypothetical protein